jgi:integrase
VKGSVKRSGDGWGFVFDVRSIDGSRRQVRRRGFPTRKVAEAEMQAAMELAKVGKLVAPKRVTVGEYLTETWLPVIATRVRPTTLDGYRRTVDRHLNGPHGVGTIELQALDEPMIELFIAGLTDRGLAAKTVKNVHAVLSKALGDAHRMKLVNRNAAHGTVLPARATPTVPTWTAAELRRFLEHVAGDRWAPMWRLIATTGIRRGEALGLRWRDVDLERGTVTITNQRTVAGGSIVEGPPKTASGRRTISLDSGTLAALKAWRRLQAGERLAMGAGWPETDHVFVWPDGSPLWPKTVTMWFRGHAEALGLANIGVHGLRHSAATWMIASGVSPKVVTQRLGHAHVSITLQLYAQVLPAHDREAATAFATAVDGAAL